MPKLVIFDMDGLMLDTERLNFKAFSDICASYGLADSRDIYIRTLGVDDNTELSVYKAAFPELDGQKFCEAVRNRYTELRRLGDYSVKPGLFALFAAIERKGGIRTAVVTSNTERVAADLLTETGIMPHLDGGVYREMVSRPKPFPDSHLLCCRMFGTDPRDSLVLEDSEPGIRAALAAGIPVIAIPDLAEPSGEILARCLARCGRLSDVIPYL
ncbi:MAG: HAD family phosphatase [Oscillospiraceae bacterium]|jgi:beta-phosphoglucomutase-like phosphatase (HAD superfamily)|nr:HAD family phosphatase [Oscillospiraceae bacterium]